ncbi:MAG: AAA family ATPase [Clostridiales bacterium]|jgi:recombinational DNA repair ATPase RecF|nr:AAA family ATPase [Clostridiales bacterium]
MLIKQLHIGSFGKFLDYSLDLPEGFAVILGKNEDGKTTLMDFIKLMLYSKPVNYANPRKRYVNLQTAAQISGAMTMQCGESNSHFVHEFYLQKVMGDTPAKDRQRLINLTTGEEVNLQKNESVGQHLLGLSPEGFEQVCFIVSGRLAAPTGAGAEEAMRNLAGSGNERISREAAIKRLTDAKESLVSKSGRAGALIKLKAELTRLADEKKRAEESYLRIAALKADYEHKKQLLAEQRDLRRIISNLAELDKAAKMENIMRLMTERDMLSESLPANRKFVINLRAVYDEYINAKRAMDQPPIHSQMIIYTSLAVIIVVSVVLSVKLSPWFLLSLLVGCFPLLIARERLRGSKLLRKHHAKFVNLASEFAQVVEFSEAVSLLRRLESDLRLYEEKASRILAMAEALDVEDMDYNALKERVQTLRAATSTNLPMPREELLERWRAIKDIDFQSILDLQRRMRATERVPAQIERDIVATKQRAAELALRYKALTLAANVMTEAADELRHSFGAMLNERASEALQKLTGGTYGEAMVMKDYEVRVKTGAQYIKPDFLSAGTLDQAYLAARFALSDITAEAEERPIFMDDALMQYDDDRAEQAIEYISQHRKGQTIIFTCHEHIAAMAERNEVKIIRM